MGHVNLYYILPESSPTNNWMLSNEDLQHEDNIVQFMKELEEMQECVSLENYCGYYDVDNVINFLEDFKAAEDYYPNPVFKLMRKKMQIWYNWRDKLYQTPENDYQIHGQEICDHTFTEMAEHQNKKGDENFVLVNHRAFNLPSPIRVAINNNCEVRNYCVADAGELFEWFAENRLPVRDFQIIAKHGENRQERQRWRGRWASPLRCSRDHAFNLLKRAIGVELKELFNYDEDTGDYFIVFKHEGDNPLNLYHGYHVETNSNEVPEDIKKRFMT